MINKEAQKFRRYKDLTIKIQRMWNVKTKAITLLIGTTRTISKSFRIHPSIMPSKQEIKEMQKEKHIEYCTHTSESTDVKVQNLFKMRNNVTCSKNL